MPLWIEKVKFISQFTNKLQISTNNKIIYTFKEIIYEKTI